MDTCPVVKSGEVGVAEGTATWKRTVNLLLICRLRLCPPHHDRESRYRKRCDQRIFDVLVFNSFSGAGLLIQNPDA